MWATSAVWGKVGGWLLILSGIYFWFLRKLLAFICEPFQVEENLASLRWILTSHRLETASNVELRTGIPAMSLLEKGAWEDQEWEKR